MSLCPSRGYLSGCFVVLLRQNSKWPQTHFGSNTDSSAAMAEEAVMFNNKHISWKNARKAYDSVISKGKPGSVWSMLALTRETKNCAFNYNAPESMPTITSQRSPLVVVGCAYIVHKKQEHIFNKCAAPSDEYTGSLRLILRTSGRRKVHLALW
jgi:hypothetical protein